MLREFLNGFESTRTPGYVSFAEFERYFATNTVWVHFGRFMQISLTYHKPYAVDSLKPSGVRSQMGIDDDNYFALMMRQAWGVSE